MTIIVIIMARIDSNSYKSLKIYTKHAMWQKKHVPVKNYPLGNTGIMYMLAIM
jgi:hypothetical protein